jgi:hypothetical protein
MACEYAGIADIEPLRSALAAIDRGRPMPVAMADPRAVSRDIIASLAPRTPQPGSPVPPMEPVVAAVQVVFAASHSEPVPADDSAARHLDRPEPGPPRSAPNREDCRRPHRHP